MDATLNSTRKVWWQMSQNNANNSGWWHASALTPKKNEMCLLLNGCCFHLSLPTQALSWRGLIGVDGQKLDGTAHQCLR
jgi:hypothetical protein